MKRFIETKNVIVFVSIFLLFLSFYAAPTKAQTQEATLSISPSSSSISSVGGTRTVNINIANAVKLGGFEFEVHYNPSVVNVASVGNVTLGSFLGSTGRSATLLSPVVDNEAGMVKIGAFSFGSTEGPSASGNLASITFTAIDDGTTDITFQKVLLSSSDTTPVSQSSTSQNATIVVGSAPDSVSLTTPFPTSELNKAMPTSNNVYKNVNILDYVAQLVRFGNNILVKISQFFASLVKFK